MDASYQTMAGLVSNWHQLLGEDGGSFVEYTTSPVLDEPYGYETRPVLTGTAGETSRTADPTAIPVAKLPVTDTAKPATSTVATTNIPATGIVASVGSLLSGYEKWLLWGGAVLIGVKVLKGSKG